jgi:hypothetical protein
VLKQGKPATMGAGERHYYSLNERELESPREILALGAMLDVLISGGTCHDSMEVCKSEADQDSNDRLFKFNDLKYFPDHEDEETLGELGDHKFRTNDTGLSWDDQTLDTAAGSTSPHDSANRSLFNLDSSFEKVDMTILASVSDDDSGVIDQQVEELIEQPTEQTPSEQLAESVAELVVATPEPSPRRSDERSFQEEATTPPTPPPSPTSKVVTLERVEQVATSGDDMEIEVGTLGIIPFTPEEGFEIQNLAVRRLEL